MLQHLENNCSLDVETNLAIIIMIMANLFCSVMKTRASAYHHKNTKVIDGGDGYVSSNILNGLTGFRSFSEYKIKIRALVNEIQAG